MSFKYIFQDYIKDSKNCQHLLIYEDDDILLIRDGFPKATLHWLLIPKNPQKTRKNPLTVFEDDDFRQLVAKHIEIAKSKMVLELNSLWHSDKATEDQLDEIASFIKTGVHSVPSLVNLHVHLITKDFHSSRMKNKKHYNSFATEFFVPFEELPLSSKDPRLDPKSMETLIKTSEMKCSYCDKNFYNKFVNLKSHLELEYNKMVESTLPK